MIKHSEAMKNKEKKPTLSEAFERWVDEQLDKHMITCCKCHGKGTYQVPYYVDDTTVEWEERDCELCQGLGKISLQFYEDLQRGCRR